MRTSSLWILNTSPTDMRVQRGQATKGGSGMGKDDEGFSSHSGQFWTGRTFERYCPYDGRASSRAPGAKEGIDLYRRRDTLARVLSAWAGMETRTLPDSELAVFSFREHGDRPVRQCPRSASARSGSQKTELRHGGSFSEPEPEKNVGATPRGRPRLQFFRSFSSNCKSMIS